MEPSLVPSFTFPSRHDMANLANGLKATLNQDYVHSVPKNSADINIETALYRADIIVPMGQQQTLDPKGVLPMPTNIYVQPGLAEGMTNLSERENAETTIMKTLSANNALKRGNYQAAEHVMGRGATTEEIQNQTTVPNKRTSQMGGPDVHVGPRSQHVGVPVRNGPNYQSMAHVASELGSYIDDAAKQLNIPEDQVIRLKTRYNLFTPSSANGRPNVPAGWQSIWELVKRDLEGMRTGTNDIVSNVPGTDNGLRQAGGQQPGPSMPMSQPAPSFKVPAETKDDKERISPVQVQYPGFLQRMTKHLGELSSALTGGKVTRSGNALNKEERKDRSGQVQKFRAKLHEIVELTNEVAAQDPWTGATDREAQHALEAFRRWHVDNQQSLFEHQNTLVEAAYDRLSKLIHDRGLEYNDTDMSSAQEEKKVRSSLPFPPQSVATNSSPRRFEFDDLGSEPEIPDITVPTIQSKNGQLSHDYSWLNQIKIFLSQLQRQPELRSENTLRYLLKIRSGLQGDLHKNKQDMSNQVQKKIKVTIQDLNRYIYKLVEDLGISIPRQPPNAPSLPTIDENEINPQDYDQDLNFARAPGNTTSDFTANNQVLAKEQAAGEELPSERLQQLPIPSETQIPPGDNPIIQEYLVDQVPLTHRSDDNRPEQAAIYDPADKRVAVAQRHPTFFGGLLNRNPFIPARDSEKLSLPRNWNIQTQLQNPPSYTEKEMTDPQKAKYVFTHPIHRHPTQNIETNTMDTYSTKRYIDAPLSQQFMTRTGRDAVPISAQIQTSQSNQHGLWEVNTRQLAQDPSRAGEQLRNEFMPQHPPQEMYEKNIGSDKPVYGVYDNTIPQGTGRLQKAPFGKHVVDLPKLFKQGVLSLSQSNGRKVSRVKNLDVPVGSGLHAALCNIATGKKPTKKMTVPEKATLSQICDRSQVDHGQYKAGAINMNPLQQLHIAMGEINAGNNAVGLKQQIRKLLSSLGKAGELNQEQISSIRTHYLS